MSWANSAGDVADQQSEATKPGREGQTSSFEDIKVGFN